MPKRPYILGLGEVLWDIYPKEHFIGGAPANVVLHAINLGTMGSICSAIGKDTLGVKLKQGLEFRGVDTLAIQENRHPTGTVHVHLDANRVPSFQCSENAAFDYLEWHEEMDSMARQVDALVIGTLAQRNEQSGNIVQQFLDKASNALKVFDVNFRVWNTSVESIMRDTLPKTDVLKLNENELTVLQEYFVKDTMNNVDFIMWMAKTFHLKLVALSLGALGCVLTDGDQYHLAEGHSVDVIDTTGCGDAFVAALILKLLEKKDLKSISDFCNIVGAFTATQNGATPLYTLSDIQNFQFSLGK